MERRQDEKRPTKAAKNERPTAERSTSNAAGRNLADKLIVNEYLSSISKNIRRLLLRARLATAHVTVSDGATRAPARKLTVSDQGAAYEQQ